MVTAAKAKAPVAFKIVDGSRIRKGDAQAIGSILERIKQTGPLTAEAVLEEAKNPRSPLHKYIEWDDSKAAHQYRLEQARKIIRSIEVVVEDAKGKSRQLRGYFNVRTSDGVKSYQPLEFVFEDADLADQVINDAKQQLDSWLAKFKKYQWAKTAVPKVAAAIRALKAATPKRRKK